MAVLSPETDGLQAKHRIKRTLKGKTREERVEEMLDIVEKEIHPLVGNCKENITKKSARIASLIYAFNDFKSQEIYEILKKENIKNYC